MVGCKVKPSGGIRNYETAKMYVDMGASRLGCGYTSCKPICEGEGESSEAYSFRATPHNSAARQALPFPPSAACRSLDLPPVNLRNCIRVLPKNPFAGRPPHLCGVALEKTAHAGEMLPRCAVVIQNRNTRAKDTASCYHSSLQTGAYGWMIPACAGFFMRLSIDCIHRNGKTWRDQWLFSRMRNAITRLIRSARNGAALVADESDVCPLICCLCIHSCFSSCERMARSSIMRLICPFSRTRKRAA